MDVPLDRVAVVAEHEDDGVQGVADHGGDFLGGELEAAVADEEDGAAWFGGGGGGG